MLTGARRRTGQYLLSAHSISNVGRQLQSRLRHSNRLFAHSAISRQQAVPHKTASSKTSSIPSATSSSPSPSRPPTNSITKLSPPHDPKTGLQDPLPSPDSLAVAADGTAIHVDWSRSFAGLSTTSFSAEASAILMEPLSPLDVEVKPDGIIYLPEIKYRRILNRAFGPGAWGLAPRGETIVTAKSVTREYGLVVQGRLVSIARGEQQYFDPEGIPTATEGCKSNALMRCCKDLGIASELWDPVFIRQFMATHAKEVWVEHMTTKKKRKIYMRKDVPKVPYPFKEAKA